MTKLKILSLCDGVASGLEAFKRLGIEVEYHAIEIEPFKRMIADLNHPGIVRPAHDLVEFLAHIRSGAVKLEHYDYFFCGFTCTSLSSQGKREDWDGESKIFYDCVALLNECRKVNPNIKFLFENVRSMKNVCRDEITKQLGVSHFLGESALVSAQDRKRYYWFNWQQPEIQDRGITANSILDPDGLVLFSFSKSNRNEKGKPAIVEGRLKASPKTGTLVTGTNCDGQSTFNRVITKKMKIRPMTVPELSRAMTIGNYNWGTASDAQIWTAIGEGWSVDMIVELLRGSV
jgi:site-specific DNA-cytosine methylase